MICICIQMSDTTYTKTHTRSICKDGTSRVLYKKKSGRGQNGSDTLYVKVRKPDGTFGYNKFVPQEGNKIQKKQKGGSETFRDGMISIERLREIKESDELKKRYRESDYQHLERLKNTFPDLVIFDNYRSLDNGSYENYKGINGITRMGILPDKLYNNNAPAEASLKVTYPPRQQGRIYRTKAEEVEYETLSNIHTDYLDSIQKIRFLELNLKGKPPKQQQQKQQQQQQKQQKIRWPKLTMNG